MNFIDQLRSVITQHGANAYLGEPVDMQAHFLQCAELVVSQGGSDALVAAALLHDIGHFHYQFETETNNVNIDDRHGELGSKILSAYFGPEVTEPVRLHVSAKRYLCATEADYFSRLSDASVRSLVHQGGPMAKEEVIEFEANEWHVDAVMVRRADDNAKVPGTPTQRFDDHYGKLEGLLIQGQP